MGNRSLELGIKIEILKIEKLVIKDTVYFTKILQLSVISVLVGRAWQHLYWDAPFRALLWDEQLMKGIIEQYTQMNWETYSTSLEVDDAIGNTIKFFGIFYLFAGLLTIFIYRFPKFFQHYLLISFSALVFLALLYCKERFNSIGQFFEYTLQFGSPLFLWFWIRQEKPIKCLSGFLILLKFAIALTFSCHGLYAIGYYPIPVQFMEMTMNILGVGESKATFFLLSAGILDFIVAIGIFLPWKWARFFLIYAIFWGFGTTIARVWAYFDWDWLDYVLLQWLHESIMRMPHFLIPLATLVGSSYYENIKRKTA